VTLLRDYWFFIAGVALLGIQAAMLFWFGQPALCECGYIKVWEGVVQSSGNSQHISDWYTFSHFIHGLLFYWLLTLFAPKLSWGMRLAISTGIEVGWEVLENTPMVIDHYREQALAQGYTGDSILNSVSDTLAMVLGFFAARALPVWTSIVLAIGLEGTSLYFIRDGLMLNVVNLLHSFDFINHWQQGGQ
jgi:hypothetical protein